MANRALTAEVPASPGKWMPVVTLAWFVPGGGHFLLKRRGRGGLIALSIAALFLPGILMRGPLYHPQTGDLLTTIIYCGGFIADLATGVLYFLATWLGYAQPDVAGHVHDYGSKFIVAAGLLNILAMVDAYDIATGKRD